MVFKKEEQSNVRRHVKCATTAFTQARTYCFTTVTGTEWSLKRTKVSAYYDDLPHKHWYITDINDNTDYAKVLDMAANWHALGRTGIRIDLTMIVEKDRAEFLRSQSALQLTQRASATTR